MNIIDFKKLAEQVASMESISKKNNWTYSYDDELDYLYFSPKKISNNFLLFALNDEYNVYIDEKSNLGGIFIEYYKSNLSSHEKEFKPFKSLFEKRKRNKETFEEKKNQLSKLLKVEILSEIILNQQNTVSLPSI